MVKPVAGVLMIRSARPNRKRAVLAALFVGLLVAMFQAATQVQEYTLSFVPKLIVVFAVLAATGTWVVRETVRFAQLMFDVMIQGAV